MADDKCNVNPKIECQHTKTIETILVEVRAVKKLLIGNGAIGVCETVRHNTRDIEHIQSKLSAGGNRALDWAFRLFIVVFAASFGALLGLMIGQ